MNNLPPPANDQLSDSDVVRQVLFHLERMDRRDKIRTTGAFIRTMLGIIPMVFFLLSIWYAYTHTDELIRKISQEAAKQAAAYTTSGSQDLYDQIKNMVPKR